MQSLRSWPTTLARKSVTIAETFEQIALAFLYRAGREHRMNVDERTTDGLSRCVTSDISQSKYRTWLATEQGGNIENVSRACYETYGLVCSPCARLRMLRNKRILPVDSPYRRCGPAASRFDPTRGFRRPFGPIRASPPSTSSTTSPTFR